MCMPYADPQSLKITEATVGTRFTSPYLSPGVHTVKYPPQVDPDGLVTLLTEVGSLRTHTATLLRLVDPPEGYSYHRGHGCPRDPLLQAPQGE